MNQTLRIKRHKKIRKRLTGIKDKPRLSVFRSSKYIYAQIIDDSVSKTLASVNDIKMDKVEKNKKAHEVGKKIAEKALKIKIKKVIFDRGGFLYHGRVAELAKGAREGGLEF